LDLGVPGGHRLVFNEPHEHPVATTLVSHIRWVSQKKTFEIIAAGFFRLDVS